MRNSISIVVGTSLILSLWLEVYSNMWCRPILRQTCPLSEFWEFVDCWGFWKELKVCTISSTRLFTRSLLSLMLEVSFLSWYTYSQRLATVYSLQSNWMGFSTTTETFRPLRIRFWLSSWWWLEKVGTSWWAPSLGNKIRRLSASKTQPMKITKIITLRQLAAVRKPSHKCSLSYMYSLWVSS